MAHHHLPSTKKSLGQHWLSDDNCLDAMVAAAGVTADNTVLEIGPGPGTLTEKLVKIAHEVVAVEFDEALARDLPKRVSADNLRVVVSDILRFDLTQLPVGYKVVANIPYYLTSNLIRTMSESTNPPTQAAILIQKEVAERVAAKPGDMSLLSVTAQFYWEVSLGRVVKAELFMPPPKVDSQILCLSRRSQPLFDDIQPKQLFRIAKAGFGERRKTLLNSLSGGLHLEKTEVKNILEKANIAENLRAQNLSLDSWYALTKTILASETVAKSLFG